MIIFLFIGPSSDHELSFPHDGILFAYNELWWFMIISLLDLNLIMNRGSPHDVICSWSWSAALWLLTVSYSSLNCTMEIMHTVARSSGGGATFVYNSQNTTMMRWRAHRSWAASNNTGETPRGMMMMMKEIAWKIIFSCRRFHQWSRTGASAAFCMTSYGCCCKLSIAVGFCPGCSWWCAFFFFFFLMLFWKRKLPIEWFHFVYASLPLLFCLQRQSLRLGSMIGASGCANLPHGCWIANILWKTWPILLPVRLFCSNFGRISRL